MVKNYKKEIDLIQNKKQTVISELKYNQENEMKN